jgi:pre-mRNA-splicing factor 18
LTRPHPSRQAEIAKRKAAGAPAGASAPAAKVARTAEPALPPKSAASPLPPAAAAPSPAPTTISKEGTPEVDDGKFNVTNEDAVRRLRQKGQPVRLFAESERDRRMRLRALELMEERDREGGQRNDFQRTLEKLDSGLELFAARERPGTPNRARSGTPGTPGVEGDDDAGGKERGETMVDLALIKSDPYKVYPHVYWAMKKVLREWEASMDERPEPVKRSTQGKLAAATQKQSAEYLKPLFKALRKRVRVAVSIYALR